MSIEELESEIEKIKGRNKMVELNKAWETSWTRKALIVVLTYFVITLCLAIIHNPAPWINSIIPCMGFFLSTLTVSAVKKYWIDMLYSHKQDINNNLKKI